MLSCCSLLCGCAAIVAGVGAAAGAGAAVGIGAAAVDSVYSGAFRIEIEDASKLSADELRQLEDVQLYGSDEGLSYTSIGQVRSLSCKLSGPVLFPELFFWAKWRWHPALSETNGRTPEDAAKMQLKIKALRAGANAIVSSTCTHNESVDWGNNCFESWICTGNAVRVE
jgi:hypothetical protein